MVEPRTLDARELAMAAQLRAEIAASRWKKIATFARALDESGTPTDYTTFFKRVSGKAAIPTGVLLAALDLLGVDPVQFVSEALARAARETPSS